MNQAELARLKWEALKEERQMQKILNDYDVCNTHELIEVEKWLIMENIWRNEDAK